MSTGASSLVEPLTTAPTGEYVGVAVSPVAALDTCLDLRQQLLSLGVESRHVIADLTLWPELEPRWAWSLGEGIHEAREQL